MDVFSKDALRIGDAAYLGMFGIPKIKYKSRIALLKKTTVQILKISMHKLSEKVPAACAFFIWMNMLISEPGDLFWL